MAIPATVTSASDTVQESSSESSSEPARGSGTQSYDQQAQGSQQRDNIPATDTHAQQRQHTNAVQQAEAPAAAPQELGEAAAEAAAQEDPGLREITGQLRDLMAPLTQAQREQLLRTLGHQ